MTERQPRLTIFVGSQRDQVRAEEAGDKGGGEEEHGDDGDGLHGGGVLAGFVGDAVRGDGVSVGEEVVGLWGEKYDRVSEAEDSGEQQQVK